jgi:UPF0755 protein
MKKIIGWFLLLFLTTIAIGYTFFELQFESKAQLLNKQFIFFEIKKGDSASLVIQKLNQQANLAYPGFWLRWLIYTGHANNLQAGVYKINNGTYFYKLFQQFQLGDVVKFNFTIVEGTTMDQVDLRLKESPWLLYQDNMYVKSGMLEGRLLADTYQYNAGSQSTVILNQAKRRLDTQLNYIWLNRDKSIPYKNSYELLIAASLIEREVNLKSEKSLVSSVIVNRLKKHMPLQIDASVIYGLKGVYDGHLTKKMLKIDTPYNTYLHYGLPPTPISMVNEESIEVAAHPLNTPYLYYVAKGDGSHLFSDNYRSQMNAVNRYIKHKDKYDKR